MSHGTAVAYGMYIEIRIAKELGMMNEVEAEKIIKLIEKAGFQFKELDRKAVLVNTRYDKKKSNRMVKYTLPSKVGKMNINVGVAEEVVARVLSELPFKSINGKI